MRLYTSMHDAIHETERELYEFGLTRSTYSYQDKIVEGNEDYSTKEIVGHCFTICEPTVTEALEVIESWYGADVKKWAVTEFAERVGDTPLNPGEAWKLRREVWENFLEKSEKFAYTYSQRIFPQLDTVINELKEHPSTRQAIIEMYNSFVDQRRVGGKQRIPCTMHYQFFIRDNAVHAIYTARSNDFLTHFVNDIGLAIMLQDHIRSSVDPNLSMGNFIFFGGSLHAFHKDLAARGIF